MKVLLLFALLVVGVQDADTRALLNLENDWASALVNRDRVVFDRMLADGFVYTENDQMMDRASVLNSLAAGLDTVVAARNDSMIVHRFGPTTAVVTGWLIVRTRNGGALSDRHYRFTDTWVKRGSAWQIVAAQDYIASGR
ncbi:MAG TPA: nuclear transport factor 2 family protein [Gemmatimonadales bacterium]|nr:nuclear transport factor 2 family protein [Gemmatimonadales bacterium]